MLKSRARSSQVSPAPAGIDLTVSSAADATHSLPRTRGDRPVSGAQGRHALMSPPHPRGSTLIELKKKAEAMVSPAPAGIDLPGPGPARSHARLPRTRGDRPGKAHDSYRMIMSPPHPRGSTWTGPAPGGSSIVSPAPAGIDLRRRRGTTVPRGLPRTRGDRPLFLPSLEAVRESPPHPRGSTSNAWQKTPMWTVSPAPAGIDPLPPVPATQGSGLPRTRGDRPGGTRHACDQGSSPPHTRGSTPFSVIVIKKP